MINNTIHRILFSSKKYVIPEMSKKKFLITEDVKYIITEDGKKIRL